MHRPIIHNLKPTDPGYREVKFYNTFISTKPTGRTLEEKLENQRSFKKYADILLKKVKAAMK